MRLPRFHIHTVIIAVALTAVILALALAYMQRLHDFHFHDFYISFGVVFYLASIETE